MIGVSTPAVTRLDRVSRLGWAVFAVVGFVWGLPYLLVKIAVDDGVPNATIAVVRVALAAAVLLPIAWRTGALRGLRGCCVTLRARGFAGAGSRRRLRPGHPVAGCL